MEPAKTPKKRGFGIDLRGKNLAGQKNTGTKKITKGMIKAKENAESVSKNWQTLNPKDGPIKEQFIYDDIPLSNIILDEENARTRHILPGNPTKNKLPETHPDFQENQDVIDSLVVMANQFKKEPLQSAIGVYPYKNKYKILFGNRRWLAYKIAFGDQWKINSKIYKQKPIQPAVQRFIENSSIAQLSLTAKLKDFVLANNELKQSEDRGEDKKYIHLGISLTAYRKLARIIDNRIVASACLDNQIKTQKDAISIIRYAKTDEEQIKVINEINNGATVEAAIEKVKSQQKEKSRSKAGRKATYLKLPTFKGSDRAAKFVKAIQAGKLSDMDWSDVDYNDIESMQLAIERNFNALIN